MGASIPLEAWLLVGVVSALAILACASVLAGRIRHEITVHDLRVRTFALRNDYILKIRELRGITIEDDDQPASADQQADTAGSIDPARDNRAAAA